jgi:hypothetical protein
VGNDINWGTFAYVDLSYLGIDPGAVVVTFKTHTYNDGSVRESVSADTLTGAQIFYDVSQQEPAPIVGQYLSQLNIKSSEQTLYIQGYGIIRVTFAAPISE